MFWVVDSLIMRKYKQKDTLDINGSTETPRARRTEESQVRGGSLLRQSQGCKVVFQTQLQICGMVCVFYHNPVTEHHIAWTWGGVSWMWVITLQSQTHSNHEQSHSSGSVAETLPWRMAIPQGG